MRDEFDKLAASGKISKQHVEPLTTLVESGYCTHKSWGFGKITTVDTVFARMVIDFQTKAGHAMDLSFAAESLKPIPPKHIYARKISDIEALRQLAAVNHLELIKVVIQSFGGKATVEQIQQALVPDVIRDDWKKWWEAAKKELKKDGHFQVPAKKTEPVVFQEQETTLQQRMIQDFRAAKGLKAHLAIASEFIKNLNDLSDAQGGAREVIETLNAEIATHQRTQPAVALEAIFVRDELRDAAKLPPSPNEVPSKAIWLQETRIIPILEAMPAAKQRKGLVSFKESTPAWHEALLVSLNYVTTKLAGEMAETLIQGGKLDLLKEALAKLINQHQASSDLLLWLARERSDSFADILGPEVFRAMLTAMERDQFNEKKSNKLRDYIMDDQELLVELIGSADLEVIKDLTRALQLSPCFDDMDKRSLLARIVKTYPAVQSMITGADSGKQESTYIVSWESLERRKKEYTELVEKKIPANSKEIAIARSYGDLRENHEYKAAKEMQKILMRRKSELEQMLNKARGTDFSNPRTDVVSIGTTAKVVDAESQHPETYTILGAWDGDPDKGLISYLTPIGQALLGKKPGEEVEMEVSGNKRRFRINSIESYSAPAAHAPDEASAENQPTPPM